MNLVTCCYVHELRKAEKFLAHLQKWKRAFPLIIITDSPYNFTFGLDVFRVPAFGSFGQNPRLNRMNSPSDRYATWAFTHCLRFAAENKFDWLLYLEQDCRFRGDFWDELLVQPLVDRKEPPVALGTPVCWHPWSRGPEWSRRVLEYAYAYSRATGFPFTFEGGHDGSWPSCFYTNGALSVYNIETILPLFQQNFEKLTCSVVEREELAARQQAFDLYIGRRLTAKHGLALLDQLAWNPLVYSGCGNHHLTEAERLLLLKREQVVAVHQVKQAIYEFS
jgi:hypothetical protein